METPTTPVSFNPLQLAAYQGDITEVRNLLDAGASVNSDYQGASPLHYAVAGGRPEIISLLIRRGALVNAVSTGARETPLHWAARLGLLESAKLLVSHGADLITFDGTSEGRAPIHTAVLHGQANVIVWLLENNTDVDFTSRNGETPLFFAVRSGVVDIVQFILLQGADVNKRVNSDTATALHLAVTLGRQQIIQVLLDADADVTISSPVNSNTAVHCAARLGDLNALGTMWRHGADLSMPTDNGVGDAPIHLASMNNHVQMVNCLLTDIPVDSMNSKGYTPLQLACFHGSVDVAKALIAKNANINLRSNSDHKITALHLAVLGNKPEAVKMLLECGAELDIRDASRVYTGMHYAANLGHLECLKNMHESGGNSFFTVGMNRIHGEAVLATAAKYDTVDIVECLSGCLFPLDTSVDMCGLTPLHYAACFDSRRVLQFLLQKAVDVNAQDTTLRTALHMASYNGHSEAVKVLLHFKADSSIRALDKMTALHYAAKMGHLESFQRLFLYCGKKMTPVGDKYGNLSIHLAAMNGHRKIVRYLLYSGVQVDIRNSYGSTALMNAIFSGNNSLVEMLVKRKADVNAKTYNYDNKTPLHIAAFYGNKVSTELLLRNGARVNEVTSNDNRTPLHWAALKGHLEVTEVLVRNGANINVRDGFGYTAREIAGCKGFADVLLYLYDLEKL